MMSPEKMCIYKHHGRWRVWLPAPYFGNTTNYLEPCTSFADAHQFVWITLQGLRK